MPNRTQRRLAAIVSVDVVGYSRLIGDDEAGTLAAYRALRSELIDPLISTHDGRVVKTMGDGLLLEFPSVVNAVKCSIEVQQGMSTRNSDATEDKHIVFRIGINLGDIVIEGDDIHGDGVNVAARLQEASEPGGLALSGIAHESLGSLIDASFENCGQQHFKNIARPIWTWRWAPHQSSAASVPGLPEKPPALPEKPSIAVLPFNNISGEPEQEYFSDGIADDIITDLSKVSGLFVIARNSSFSFKAKAVDMKQVGRALGVRYILEGSVRRAAGKVRINVQLIESSSGKHLWADRYDGDMEDVFALQDRITESIVTTLAVSLTRAEQDRVMRKETRDMLAYDYVLRGNAYHHRMTKAGNAEACEMFGRAIALDPNFAPAHAGLAWVLTHDANFGWGADPKACNELALEHARRAVFLDDGLAKAHMVLGDVYCWMKRHEQAVTEGRTAIALDPSYAEGHMALAFFLVTSGQAEEAVGEAKKALRFNPIYAHQIYYSVLGQAYFMTKQYEAAMMILEKGVNQNPDWGPRLWLAATYAQLGQMNDARNQVKELLRFYPSYSLQHVADVLPYKNKRDLEHVLDGLRKAGLPEKL